MAPSENMTGLGYKKILTRRSSNFVHYLSPPAGNIIEPFFFSFSLSILFHLLDLLRSSRVACEYRDFKIQRRGRQRERHFKWICVLLVFTAIIPTSKAEFQATIFKFRKRNKISSLLVYVLLKTRNWAFSRRSRAKTGKKCTKKAWCTCKVVVLLINLLFFWRSRWRPLRWILKSLISLKFLSLYNAGCICEAMSKMAILLITPGKC